MLVFPKLSRVNISICVTEAMWPPLSRKHKIDDKLSVKSDRVELVTEIGKGFPGIGGERLW